MLIQVGVQDVLIREIKRFLIGKYTTNKSILLIRLIQWMQLSCKKIVLCALLKCNVDAKTRNLLSD